MPGSNCKLRPLTAATLALCAALLTLSAAPPAHAQGAISRPGTALSPRDIGTRDFGRREFETQLRQLSRRHGQGRRAAGRSAEKEPA
jgi:hypothetical protein